MAKRKDAHRKLSKEIISAYAKVLNLSEDETKAVLKERSAYSCYIPDTMKIHGIVKAGLATIAKETAKVTGKDTAHAAIDKASYEAMLEAYWSTSVQSQYHWDLAVKDLPAIPTVETASKEADDGDDL